jgi:hypothetical protein
LFASCSDKITPTIKNLTVFTQDDGKLVATFETNLPDGVEMDVSILSPSPNKNSFGTGALDDPYTYPKITNGKFIGWFSSANKYGMEKGNYTILVSILPNQAALGVGNEKLAGEHVKMAANSKSFELRLQRIIPGVAAHP